MGSARDRQKGFTLVELSIALVLLLVGLMIAADLLMETSQLFAETSGEDADTPVPLVVARIRGDVQGSSAAWLVPGQDGTLFQMSLQRTDRTILYQYQKADKTIYRWEVIPGKPVQTPEPFWRRVTGWESQGIAHGLVKLSVTYERRAVPHSPLPGMPVDRGTTQTLTQSMYLLPRGSGLGDTW